MLKPTLQVKRKDRGLRKRKKIIAKAARNIQAITLGIHGDAGSHPTGMSIVEIAAIHEFGLGQEQRSFVRAWAEEKHGEIERALKAGAGQVVKGRLTSNQVLEQLGSLFKASMQARISAGIEPPNAPNTVAQKGSSTPLVDEGILKASIDYKVDK